MTKNTSRSRVLKGFAALATVGLLISACGSSDSTTQDTTAATQDTAAADTSCPDAALVEAANTEGQVNLHALADNWANYKGILQSFRDKYPGIANPVADPDASSADSLTAVEILKGQPDMPDAIDVSPAISQEVDTKGLWEQYQPCNWDEIPDVMKDSSGKWVAAYYGIMAIGTNTTIVKDAPDSFLALKDPKYKGLVSLNGDPREAGAAFAAVMAASIANGGSFDNILPGIEYFAELKKLGNLAGTHITEATVISGETPVWLDWTYNYPGLAPKLIENGITWSIRVPTDGVYGGFYVQGGVVGSPHPNAAKLWINHIISDEGALGYLEGGAIPARFTALVAAGKVSTEMMKNLPAPELIASIKFPTPAQIKAAKEILAAEWGPKVADQ